jgi:hypothetical protein
MRKETEMQQITLDRTAKSTENWQGFINSIKPVQYPNPNTVVSRIVKIIKR